MKYENGALQLNHLVGEILLMKHENKPETLTFSVMEDAEDQVAASVFCEGPKWTLDQLKIERDSLRDAKTRHHFEEKYGVCLVFGLYPIREDLVVLKDRYHDVMRVACESGMIDSGLQMVRKSSLLGVAYYQAAQQIMAGGDEFRYPPANEIFRQFRKIIRKLSYAGITTPEYNQFL